MHIDIDKDVCIGAGQCALSAPGVFTQDDDGFSALLPGREDGGGDPMIREAARALPGGRHHGDRHLSRTPPIRRPDTTSRHRLARPAGRWAVARLGRQPRGRSLAQPGGLVAGVLPWAVTRDRLLA